MGITIAFILVALAIGMIAAVIAGNKKARDKSEPAPRRARSTFSTAPKQQPPTGETFKWPRTGDFGFPVVGESNYRDALQAIAGDHGKKKARVECVAELFPDDDNSFDDKAVEVLVNGRTVGFLGKADARKFRRRLGQKGLTGQRTFCDAVIAGGGEWRGERRDYGIFLDIKRFDE